MFLHLPVFIRHTIIYGVSIALMRSVSLLMLPVTAYFLSVNDFGLLELLSTIAILGSVVVGLGLEDALFRFAGKSQNTSDKKIIAANIFTLTLVLGGIVILLTYPFSLIVASYIPGSPSVYAVQLVLLMLAFEGVIAVPLGWLRMRDRISIFFFLTVGRAFSQALLSFIFLFSGRGVEGVLEAGFLSALLQSIFLIYFQYKDTGLNFDFTRSKKIIVYSVPIVGSGLLAFGLNGFDRIVIADVISVEQVAIYSVAIKFSIVVTILMQPFGMWWMPKRFSELSSSNGKEKVLYYSTIGLVLVMIFVLLVGVVAPFIISYAMPDEYMESIAYLSGLLIVVALKEMTEFVNIGCFSNSKTYVQLWINGAVSVLGVFAISYSVLLYQVWGVIGSLIVVHACRLTLFFIYSQKSIRLNYPLVKILSLFFLSVAFLLLILFDFIGFQFYMRVILGFFVSALMLTLMYRLLHPFLLNAEISYAAAR